MPVAESGVTRLSEVAGLVDVSVTITTRLVDGLHPGHPEARLDVLRCGGVRAKCSVVDELRITARGRTVEVPISSFSDLAQVHYARLTVGERRSTLTLTGGDASTSYEVKIEFDREIVRRRTLAPGEFVDHPLEETVYHKLPPLGD